MNFPSESEKRILIPAVLRDGKWVPFYGGEMPELVEGTLADLLVPSHAFVKPADMARFTEESVVVLLPAGSMLWATMSGNHGLDGPEAPELKGFPAKLATESGRFVVGFEIKEDLYLRLRGTKQGQLEPCRCLLPGFPDDLGVGSINQAYTRLSERYEPRRKSHSGNVFQQVLFEEAPKGALRPLDELRLKAEAEWEKKLMTSGEMPSRT